VKTDVPPPPPVPAGKIGVLSVVSNLGIYVKLEPGALEHLSPGDVLEVYRDGQRVGEIIIEKKSNPEGNFPNGSLKCNKSSGLILRGDEVRNKK
jgi:hypothetical protein